MEAETELTALAGRCLKNGGRSCDEFLTALSRASLDEPGRDQALNQLAMAAAESPAAVDVLVRVIYQERFVRAEIRKVLIGDTSAAEEALQETALAMVKALPGFRGDSTFRTWVSSIGKNRAIGILRRARPTETLDDDASEVARFSSTLASRADIEKAMSMLPDHFRQTVRLRDIENHSYEEIASILGIELNTVRSRLARGRAKLSAMFEAEGQPPGGQG